MVYIDLYIFYIKSCLGARVITSTYSGGVNGLAYVNDLQCTSNEEHLLNCTYTLDLSCWDDYLGLSCTAKCTDGAVRIVGGMSETEGDIEICLFGNWNKVCNSTNSQTYKEAQVVCKQFGYPYSGILMIVFQCI